MFHDRRLQYTEHQQLEGWKWNRPGDRLLDLGIIVSLCCHCMECNFQIYFDHVHIYAEADEKVLTRFLDAALSFCVV